MKTKLQWSPHCSPGADPHLRMRCRPTSRHVLPSALLMQTKPSPAPRPLCSAACAAGQDSSQVEGPGPAPEHLPRCALQRAHQLRNFSDLPSGRDGLRRRGPHCQIQLGARRPWGGPADTAGKLVFLGLPSVESIAQALAQCMAQPGALGPGAAAHTAGESRVILTPDCRRERRSMATQGRSSGGGCCMSSETAACKAATGLKPALQACLAQLFE